MTATDPSAEVLDASVVLGDDGTEIGKVGQIYTDNETGQPSWVTVKTGWFGTSESFVPLNAASIDGDTIRVPYDKDRIKGAPHNDAGEPLSETDEQELYAYYGLSSSSGRSDSRDAETPARTATDHSSEYMTRSEEQLQVGTEKVQTGRARLRKVIVTEQQTITVPVTREEVRLVREPIGADHGVDTTIGEIGEAATDLVLTEERVVVSKETVPVEKVRLGTETITEQKEVTEAVRKEQIELDDATVTTDDPRFAPARAKRGSSATR
jgi:uncharacterized protein (TIGR02271 family)